MIKLKQMPNQTYGISLINNFIFFGISKDSKLFFNQISFIAKIGKNECALTLGREKANAKPTENAIKDSKNINASS